MSKFVKILALTLGLIIFFLEAKTAFNYPFVAAKAMPLRMTLSIGIAAFLILVIGVFVSMAGSIFWFLKMANSPREGLTIMDTRPGNGRPVYSDKYLNESGLFARSRLWTMTKWLLGCWIGAVLLGIFMYYVSR